MTRAAAALALLVVLLLSACREDLAAQCDDARFLDQSEELYASLTAAKNASERAAPDALLVADLRAAGTLLRSHLEASPPCSDGLATLATREGAAADDLERAADLLQGGAGGALQGLLDRALAVLAAAEKRSR